MQSCLTHPGDPPISRGMVQALPTGFISASVPTHPLSSIPPLSSFSSPSHKQRQLYPAAQVRCRACSSKLHLLRGMASFPTFLNLRTPGPALPPAMDGKGLEWGSSATHCPADKRQDWAVLRSCSPETPTSRASSIGEHAQ